MNAAEALRHLLESTRDEEVDCDRFLEHLPALLDGRIEDPVLRERLAHHIRQCAECSEELALVTREVIQLRKARGLRAGLAPVALVIGVIVLAGWLLAVALHDQVSGSAVLAGVNGAMAAITFAMFRRRSDFTR